MKVDGYTTYVGRGRLQRRAGAREREADLLGKEEYQTVRVSQNWVNGLFGLRRCCFFFLGENVVPMGVSSNVFLGGVREKREKASLCSAD